MNEGDALIKAAELLHVSILTARRAIQTGSNYRRHPTHVRIHPGDWEILQKAAAEVGADIPVGSKLWSLIVELDPSVGDPVVEARNVGQPPPAPPSTAVLH